jgi:hypothetical protein
MNTAEPLSEPSQALALQGAERWEVYRRLETLEISCQCLIHQPLQVHLESPLAIAQLWSVVKQVTAPRTELVQWLERCWQLESDR